MLLRTATLLSFLICARTVSLSPWALSSPITGHLPFPLPPPSNSPPHSVQPWGVDVSSPRAGPFRPRRRLSGAPGSRNRCEEMNGPSLSSPLPPPLRAAPTLARLLPFAHAALQGGAGGAPREDPPTRNLNTSLKSARPGMTSQGCRVHIFWNPLRRFKPLALLGSLLIQQHPRLPHRAGESTVDLSNNSTVSFGLSRIPSGRKAS